MRKTRLAFFQYFASASPSDRWPAYLVIISFHAQISLNNPIISSE